MNKKTLLMIGVVFAAVLLAVVVFSDSANVYAADTAGKGDKSIATKEGVGESLGDKKFEEDKLPGPFKIGFAIGSLITMIVVVKVL